MPSLIPPVTTVLLGNRSPMMQQDGVSVPAEHLSTSVTRVEFPAADATHDSPLDPAFAELTLSTNNDRVLSMIARTLGEHRGYAVAVSEIEQIIAAHSGGQAPAWVSSDDEGLQAAVAAFYDCPVGEPVALLTTVGRDALHAQHMLTGTQPAVFNFMAVSANAAAPAAASTTLPGEITTVGGGLLRGAATMAHTAGTNTTTGTRTVTANGSDTLPVTLAKIGMLNASTAGTLGYETLLSASATLTVSGDSCAITWTETAG